MSSTYSSNLGVNLMATGDQSGNWGNVTNLNEGTLFDQAIAAYVYQPFANADITLTTLNGADAGSNTTAGLIYGQPSLPASAATPVSARNMYIECNGTTNYTQNLILPITPKLYYIYNNTTSSAATTSTSGTTTTVATTAASGTVTTATTGTAGTGTVATISFAALSAAPIIGSQVTVSGVTPSGYNGTFTVTASTTTSVSFTSSATGTQTVAGTIRFNTATISFAAQSVAPTVGTTVTISGVTPSGYTGTYTIIGSTTTTITYSQSSTTGPQTVAGTIAFNYTATATVSFAAMAVAPPVGSSVTISGVTPSGYNGTYTITASTTSSVSFLSATTGSQTVAGTIAFPTGGAIKVYASNGTTTQSSNFITIPIGYRIAVACNGATSNPSIVPAFNSISGGTGANEWLFTLPATSGTAGQALTTNANNTTSWTSVQGVSQTYTTVSGNGTTAVVFTRYHLNSLGGAFTLTMPASASAGDWVQFIDVGQYSATNNITLANNGLKIMNNLANMAININSAAFYLVYDTTYGWVVS